MAIFQPGTRIATFVVVRHLGSGRVASVYEVVAPDGMLDITAPNVLVRPSVPQLELLPHLDAVVCHAGHNTVCEALAHGVPLVVAPIRFPSAPPTSRARVAPSRLRSASSAGPPMIVRSTANPRIRGAALTAIVKTLSKFFPSQLSANNCQLS